jgi:hypothetical protein
VGKADVRTGAETGARTNATAVEAAALLYELRARGFVPAVRPSVDQAPEKPRPPVLAVDGPQELDDALRERIRAHKVQLKLLVLFESPPAWLRQLAARCVNETPWEVRRTNPATGKIEIYVVRVRPRQVAVAVAAEVGADSYYDVLDETLDFLAAWPLEEAAC